jgi:hypothetical protein
MRIRIVFAGIGSALALAGCMAKSLSPAGSQVAVVSEAPAGCERLGELAGLSPGGMRGDMSSPHDLELGARNDLRNRAALMGADTVQTLGREGIVTHSFAGHARPSQVRHTGVAWRCRG